MNIRRISVFLLVLFCVSCGPKPESNKTASTGGQPSTPLFDNLGSHHHVVTTSNETAHKYFDQGLRFIYGFNHDEAERSFREAARIDPNLAMAWWGVAYAVGPNYNQPMSPEQNARALEAVQKAQSLQSGANEQERA